MKISNPLDKILNNEAKVRILRFLFKTNAQWNGRQIAKEVGVSPATAHKALQSLNKEGVLLLRNMGKTHVYALNQNSFTVSVMLKPLFNREKEVLNRIFNIIKRKISASGLKNDIISVVLFGSVSSRKDNSISDIDLAIIVKDLKIIHRIESLFAQIDKKIVRDFGNTITPYINTRAQFKAKYKKGLRVIKDILKSGKLIYGKEMGRII